MANDIISNRDLLHNYFYGTENHYYHPGWYFDLIVNGIEDLENNDATNIRPGRFILVANANAIFMRTGNDTEYYFVKSCNYSNSNQSYYYNDFRHISGQEKSETLDNIISQEYPNGSVTTTVGYRFIAYTNKMAQIILKHETGDSTGSLVVPYSTDGKPIIYGTTSDLGYMASYYFGL